MSTTPEWYNPDRLTKINFEKDERGWAVAIGDGLYRLANHPIRAACNEPGAAGWGDLVRLVPNNGDKSWLEIVEKYVLPETTNEGGDGI